LPIRLTELGWPEEFQVILHNHLFDRGLFELKDIQKNTIQQLEGVLKATFKMSMNQLHGIYYEEFMGS